MLVLIVVVARSGLADFISSRESGARNEASKSFREKGYVLSDLSSADTQFNFWETTAATARSRVSRRSSFIVLLKGR